MTEKSQIHTLLADLADQPSPVDIDVDRQIQLGRRRHRRRLTAALCTAGIAVPAVLVGGVLTLRPSPGTDAPAVAATPSVSPVTPSTIRLPGEEAVRSTETSKALLAEVGRLIPELAQLEGARQFDMEMRRGDKRSIHAGTDLIYEGQGGGQVTVSVVVASKGEWRACKSLTGFEPCTRIEKLPDGSTAYLRTYIVPSTIGHAYEVTLAKPDGTGVTVSSAAYRPKGSQAPDAPLSLDRVLEIALQITIKP